uniref:Uncharacterized protein n=1 Tax=Siphoviridae sp. ct3r22 TaxID=2825325 RepID=A0A8S5V1C1_9CAUD|nr:MAG TPA: hypothetical protein [Siphoviridae sp. ct3r22]
MTFQSDLHLYFNSHSRSIPRVKNRRSMIICRAIDLIIKYNK